MMKAVVFSIAVSMFLLFKQTLSACPNRKDAVYPFLWPMRVNPRIVTSTLGEFRYVAFHGGIDFSTNNKNQSVIAMRGGTLRRVMFGRYNIGYGVWIDHPDGTYTKYGHLKTFSKKIIASLPQQIQQKIILREDFNFFPKKKLPISQGELIAISGDTGIGGQHLHIEYWKGNDRLSLLHYGLYYEDPIAPELQSVTLVPLEPSARINGKYEELTIKLTNSRKRKGKFNRQIREFSIQKIKGKETAPIVLSGRIGVKLSVYDLANGKSRLGVSRTQLAIGGNEIYQYEMCELPMVPLFWQNLVFDRNNSTFSGQTRYTHFLYERSSLTLPFVKSVDRGIITANPRQSKHIDVKISAADPKGNESIFQYSFPVDTKSYQPVTLPVWNAFPEKENIFQADDKSVKVIFPKNALIEPERILISRFDRKISLPKGLEQKSQIYFVYPNKNDFLKNYQVRFFMPHQPRVAIYKMSHSESSSPEMYWLQSHSVYPSGTVHNRNFYQTWQGSTGAYLLIQDNQPPTWGPASIQNGKTYLKNQLRIFLRLRDIGHGPNLSTLKVQIDGIPCHLDHDADRNHVEVFHPLHIYNRGRHTLTATFQDYAGHKAPPLSIVYHVR